MTATLVKTLPAKAAAKHIADKAIAKAADPMQQRMNDYVEKERAKTAAKAEADAATIQKSRDLGLMKNGTAIPGNGTKKMQTPQDKARASAEKAQGHAVATVVIEMAKEDGSKWMRAFNDIFALTSGARAEFRKELNMLGKQMRAVNADVKRTAFTRISECINLSRACDAGMTKDDVAAIWNKQGTGKQLSGGDMTHAACVYAQRVYRESKAADGIDVKGPTRRVAMTPVQRAMKYLLSNFNGKEIAAIVKAVPTTLGKVKADKDVASTLSTLFPKAAAKAAPKGAAVATF